MSTIDVAAAAREHARRLYAQKSLEGFGAAMDPAYETAAHIRVINDHLERLERREIRKLIIECPPRHSKTYSLERFMAWYLGRNPSHSIIEVGYSAALATRTSRRVRDLVANPAYPFDAKLRPDMQSVEQWMMSGGGTFLAAGIDGAATGFGANLLLVDDPIRSREDANSALIREQTWSAFNDNLRTRLMPNGVICLCATRWHLDDVIGRLLASPEGSTWTVLRLPAIAEDDDPLLGRAPGEALWPRWFPVESLEETRKALGAVSFAALYQQNPVPSTGATFKREYLSHFYDGPPPVASSCVFSLDPAAGAKQYNDNCALVIAFWDGKDVYIHDIIAQRLEYVDLRRLMLEQAAIYRPTRLIIERSSSGLALISDLRQSTALNILDVTVTRDKMARVQSVMPWLEAGRVLFRNAAYYDEFVEEALRFPSTAKDDRVDALTQLLEVVRTSSMPQPSTTLTHLSNIREGFAGQRIPATVLPGWNFFAHKNPLRRHG